MDEPLKSYTAAALVYDPAWGDLEGNIARIAAAADAAGAQGVKLAVLPEQATIGSPRMVIDFEVIRIAPLKGRLQPRRVGLDFSRFAHRGFVSVARSASNRKPARIASARIEDSSLRSWETGSSFSRSFANASWACREIKFRPAAFASAGRS